MVEGFAALILVMISWTYFFRAEDSGYDRGTGRTEAEVPMAVAPWYTRVGVGLDVLGVDVDRHGRRTVEMATSGDVEA